MKAPIIFLFFSFSVSAAFGQHTETKVILPDASKPIQVVDVSCGKCKLGLPGKTCDLAEYGQEIRHIMQMGQILITLVMPMQMMGFVMPSEKQKYRANWLATALK